MEDFNALASSLAQGVGDVRGCLILSRDGLVLGAHPAEAEGATTPAWVRFAAIGDPERGFAQFGTETWCYVRRGPYAGFALAGPGARPGLVIDHMDQVLLAAEEGRSRHEGLRGTEAVPVAMRPSPSRRSHLHPEHPTSEPLVIEAPAPLVAADRERGPTPTSSRRCRARDPSPSRPAATTTRRSPSLRPTPSPASWSTRATPRRRRREPMPEARAGAGARRWSIRQRHEHERPRPASTTTRPRSRRRRR